VTKITQKVTMHHRLNRTKISSVTTGVSMSKFYQHFLSQQYCIIDSWHLFYCDFWRPILGAGFAGISIAVSYSELHATIGLAVLNCTVVQW